MGGPLWGTKAFRVAKFCLGGPLWGTKAFGVAKVVFLVVVFGVPTFLG